MQRLLSILLCSVSISLQAAEKIEAQLDWAQRVELSTLVSGAVTQVNVQPGQFVKAGELLLQLDNRQFKAELEKARAVVANASAEYDEANKEQDRTQQLHDRDLISDHELDVAKINANKATALLRKSEAVLVQAQLDLEYSEIRAPFDAVVLQKRVEANQVIVSSLKVEPLLVVAKKGAMVVKAGIGQSLRAKLSLGQKVMVQIGNKQLEGSVQSMAPEPSGEYGKTASYPIVVYLETGNQQYAAGTEATVIIP